MDATRYDDKGRPLWSMVEHGSVIEWPDYAHADEMEALSQLSLPRASWCDVVRWWGRSEWAKVKSLVYRARYTLLYRLGR